MAYDLEDYSECGRCPSFSFPKEHRGAEKCFGNWICFRPSLFLPDTLDQVLFHLFTCERKEIRFSKRCFLVPFGTPADGQSQKQGSQIFLNLLQPNISYSVTWLKHTELQFSSGNFVFGTKEIIIFAIHHQVACKLHEQILQ